MISWERDVVICKCWKAESKNKVYRTHVILKFNHVHEGKAFQNLALYLLSKLIPHPSLHSFCLSFQNHTLELPIYP